MRQELLDLIGFIKDYYTDKKNIPLHEPALGEDEKKIVLECIDSTFISAGGKYTDLLEEKIAKYTGVKHAIATSNGTSGLHIALLLAGVRPGTEVITQSLSFVATSNSIRYCGADPIFTDVDNVTLGMSVESLESFLHDHAFVENERCINSITKKVISACLPMHTFGHPCHIEKIKEICTHWKIELVEDAAEALGSFYKNEHLGTFGKLSVLSFNGNKIVTGGAGGAILTNDECLAKRAKHLTTTAKLSHAWEYNHDEIGYNYRLPNINAAILCSQLDKLEFFLQNKRKTAKVYAEWCASKQIDFVNEPEFASSNYWLNAIVLADQAERDEFLNYSNSQGVNCRPAWKLLHRLPMFEACLKTPLETAEMIEARLVNLPSSVKL